MTSETGDGQCQACLERAKKPHVRMWHGLTRLDLTKPPVPVLRWMGIVLTGIIYVAAGAPTRLGDWLWAAIIGGALLLPDIVGFGVAGVRVDLRKTQEDVAALRNEIHAKASAVANVTFSSEVFRDAIGAAFRVVQAEQDPTEVYEPPKKRQLLEDED
jgi:hypothetical protein